eukprot:Colp12_sorted_trinity150504_noHs@30949
MDDWESTVKIVATISTVVSVVLSVVLVKQHLSNWTNPAQQKLIVCIILMVPLFACDSLLGLFEAHASESVIMTLDSIKEIYEAVVIFAFLRLMYDYMNVKKDKKIKTYSVPDSVYGRHVHQSFPFNLFMKDFEVTPKTAKKMELWTKQFVFLRPVLSIVSVAAELLGIYEHPLIYWPISIALNISVTLAVYALICFYHAFEKELSHHRPLAKFLCIKMVVFFAFWQYVILVILEHFEVVHGDRWYTADEVTLAIQNFLVCVEMGLIFAPAHIYAFPVKDYIMKHKKEE